MQKKVYEDKIRQITQLGLRRIRSVNRFGFCQIIEHHHLNKLSFPINKIKAHFNSVARFYPRSPDIELKEILKKSTKNF